MEIASGDGVFGDIFAVLLGVVFGEATKVFEQHVSRTRRALRG